MKGCGSKKKRNYFIFLISWENRKKVAEVCFNGQFCCCLGNRKNVELGCQMGLKFCTHIKLSYLKLSFAPFVSILSTRSNCLSMLGTFHIWPFRDGDKFFRDPESGTKLQLFLFTNLVMNYWGSQYKFQSLWSKKRIRITWKMEDLFYDLFFIRFLECFS